MVGGLTHVCSNRSGYNGSVIKVKCFVCISQKRVEEFGIYSLRSCLFIYLCIYSAFASPVLPPSWEVMNDIPHSSRFTCFCFSLSAATFKLGFMEAASHWTKPFLFQFGLTALFIPCRFKNRRLGGEQMGGGNAIKRYSPPNFTHTYVGKANSPEQPAPKETSVNR